MDNIWFAIWFFLPAGAANVMPVLLAKAPGLRDLETPVDGGRHWRGQRILGDHKTWRGLVTGVVAGVLTIWLQALLYEHYAWARQASMQLDYTAIPYLTLGFLLGFGALLGDMIKSFAKRQLGVPPGHSWFPFDQIDYIVGALLFSLPIVRLHLVQYFWIIVLWFGIHLLTSYLGFYLHFKSSRI
jgi:CDP-2,3-bis-(O-geranylgeranyl)-sn-glycerol synthase